MLTAAYHSSFVVRELVELSVWRTVVNNKQPALRVSDLRVLEELLLSFCELSSFAIHIKCIALAVCLVRNEVCRVSADSEVTVIVKRHALVFFDHIKVEEDVGVLLGDVLAVLVALGVLMLVENRACDFILHEGRNAVEKLSFGLVHAVYLNITSLDLVGLGIVGKLDNARDVLGVDFLLGVGLYCVLIHEVKVGVVAYLDDIRRQALLKEPLADACRCKACCIGQRRLNLR